MVPFIFPPPLPGEKIPQSCGVAAACSHSLAGRGALNGLRQREDPERAGDTFTVTLMDQEMPGSIGDSAELPGAPQGEGIKNRALSCDPYRCGPGEAPPKLKASRRHIREDIRARAVSPDREETAGSPSTWDHGVSDWCELGSGSCCCPLGLPWVCCARMDAEKLTTKLKHS
ncbi:hypothetical protein NDU88_005239 [Pleurodeles waltl]|uniref:Uncharacterized protein n=1 Tax=Pleurodeles waltl TaxID=8319 RepID=A0AAV7TA11_PLEWA|nr:hypothetical protein NDU88_005239 [Pleurodeles waltl]